MLFVLFLIYFLTNLGKKNSDPEDQQKENEVGNGGGYGVGWGWGRGMIYSEHNNNHDDEGVVLNKEINFNGSIMLDGRRRRWLRQYSSHPPDRAQDRRLQLELRRQKQQYRHYRVRQSQT